MAEGYVALYRRWRPQNFASLVGQQAVKTALTNALKTGRIAHAYLFTGPRGTGKTSTARILAKALNCEHGPTAEPCDACNNCQRIAAGNSMDVFEIDAASNRGIDEIKALRDQLAFTPVESRYKIYIIDEVHMLTTEAFNALLKTLEEPPAHIIFILATTDPQNIPATIHSRCQRFDFRRVTVEDIAAHLKEVAAGSGLEADEDALRLIAIQAEGGMRDALSLLDQCGVMNAHITVDTVRGVLGIVGREGVRSLVQNIGQGQLSHALSQFNALLAQGKAVEQVLAETSEYLRALLLYKSVPDYEEIYLTDTKESLEQLAPLFTQERLLAAEERLHEASRELRYTMRARITAEMALVDLCRNEGSTLAALAARVAQLESQLAGGVQIGAPVYTAPNVAVQSPAPVGEPISPPIQKQKSPTRVAQAAVPVHAESVSAATTAPAAAEEKAAPNSGQRQEAQPAKTAPKEQAPQSQVAQSTEYEGDIAMGEDYWRHMLEILQGERKMAMVSCAKNGRVFSFANDCLTIAFKMEFLCNRVKADDYRKMIEEVLFRIARKPIRLEAITEAEGAKRRTGGTAAPVPKRKVSAAVEANLSVQKQAAHPNEVEVPPEQLPPNLQKAFNAFGGSITEIKGSK